MRMRVLVIVCLALCVALFALPVLAQTQTTGDDEKIVVNKNDLSPEQLAQIQLKNKLEIAGKFAGMGHEVGVAVDEGLSAVTKHAEEISQTNVGRFVMVLIAWKVMGRDLVQVVVGIPLFIVVIAIFIWSYRRNCLSRPILKYVDKDGRKEYDIHEGSDEEKWAHVIIFIITILICCAITFW